MICWLEAVGTIIGGLVALVASAYVFIRLQEWLNEHVPEWVKDVGAGIGVLFALFIIGMAVASVHESLCPKHKPMHVSVSLPLNPLSSTSGGAA